MRRYINEGLTEFLGRALVPWHMPGHKRKKLFEQYDSDIDEVIDRAFGIDVTEVPDTDDLYEPKEMILHSLNELKKEYKTTSSYYLVNGATGGVLAALYAAREYARHRVAESECEGPFLDDAIGKVIVASNCHKSVYNALNILGLKAVFIEPEEYVLRVKCKSQEGADDYSPKNEKQANCVRISGGISPEKVRNILQTEKIFAMVLTSPTYEGVVSDIRAISDELAGHDALCIVDEAHGAHLHFFGEQIGCVSAIKCGADIVVESLHKTLPALTQTAIMHVMNESLDTYVKEGLQIFMSSSPSYILLCSMENAIAWAGGNDFSEYIALLNEFRERAKCLENLHVLEKEELSGGGAFSYDITRIVIAVGHDSFCGAFFARLLQEEYGIVVEMAGVNYVVLISSAADEREDFDRLFSALKDIDDNLKNGFFDFYGDKNHGNNALWQEGDIDGLCNFIEKLRGTTARENLYVYPPGSYIVRHGEVITDKKADELLRYVRAGLHVRGLRRD